MLTQQNTEAELSYAYLHAVASQAGFACEFTTRHMDSAAVDAIVREDGRFLAPDSVLSSFDVHIQLKATCQQLASVRDDHYWSFPLPIGQYNKLRTPNVLSPRLLVVLQLPRDPADWVRHSPEALVARECAYWVSLRGAAASQNEKDQTVYIPRSQRLSPDNLTVLMTRFSRREVIPYAQ